MGKKVTGKHVYAILLILTLAILIRSLPAWTNAAWGGDLGIYFGIASRMLESKEIFVDYDGWGNSYQYFPMLYIISLAIHLITGLDLMTVMVKFAPILGGLTVLIFYFIIMELTRNRKIALTSSALLAVAPFHVYQTSHAAPLTVGHLFMLLSILFFIKHREDRKYLFPLALSTFLLVLSHHLTTYFYMITIAGMIIWRNFKFDIPKKENVTDFAYLFATSLFAFSYWRFVAKPVYFSFMRSGLHLEPWQTILLYFVLILASFATVKKLRKKKSVHEFLSRMTVKWCQNFTKVFAVSFIMIVSLELPFLFFKIPATSIKMNPTAILLSLPIITFSSFAVAGAPFLSISKRRSFLQGWLLVISLSFLYALLTGNTTLYPDRHIEYLMVPMAASAAFGIAEVEKEMDIDFHTLRKKLRHLSTDVAVLSLLITIVLSNALIVYPARYSFRNLDERFSEACFSAIEWLREHTDSNDTIATDLRLSDFVWAYGMKATFDKTNITWSCTNWRDCLSELEGNENHGRVTYVLIDDVMKDSVVYLNVDLYVHMSNESYEKFSKEPFELVYRCATLDSNGEEVHWAEVYRVNWSYIEEFESTISS